MSNTPEILQHFQNLYEMLAADQLLAEGALPLKEEEYFQDWLIESFSAHTFGLDGECIDDEDSYDKVLDWYFHSDSSIYRLTDINTHNDWDTGKATVSFTLNGQHFKTSFTQEGDYVSGEFIKFINKAVKKAIKHRFVDFPCVDQISTGVLLPNKLAKKYDDLFNMLQPIIYNAYY